MLDADLAVLYGVETKALNRAVRRNDNRFPRDFMFQLTLGETENLKRQFGTSNSSRSGRRYRHAVFTEQGVAMLSAFCAVQRAVRVNIEIMRAFIRLRQWLASNASTAQKLENLEKKYDDQFKVVFKAIRELMEEEEQEAPARPTREIGFHAIPAGGNTRVKARSKNLRGRTVTTRL